MLFSTQNNIQALCYQGYCVQQLLDLKKDFASRMQRAQVYKMIVNCVIFKGYQTKCSYDPPRSQSLFWITFCRVVKKMANSCSRLLCFPTVLHFSVLSFSLNPAETNNPVWTLRFLSAVQPFSLGTAQPSKPFHHSFSQLHNLLRSLTQGDQTAPHQG